MPKAAFPTDFIVKAENAYGIIDPKSKQEKTKGSSKESYYLVSLPYEYILCKNPPYNAKPTKVALPIANPLPTAAVVLPAASKTSVLYLT